MFLLQNDIQLQLDSLCTTAVSSAVLVQIIIIRVKKSWRGNHISIVVVILFCQIKNNEIL